MNAKVDRVVGIVSVVLFLMVGSVQAQVLGGNDLSQSVAGPGIIPLGPLEGDVLEHVSVGIPIAPGISIDYKLATDRNSTDSTLNKSGLALSLPYGDVTFGLSGEVSFNGTGPGVADIPNYLVPALLPPGLSRLVLPFKIGGGTTYGPSSVSLGQNGGQR